MKYQIIIGFGTISNTDGVCLPVRQNRHIWKSMYPSVFTRCSIKNDFKVASSKYKLDKHDIH